ncbi:putative RING finger protein nhl-1-like [Apostichopus japonicus]|uniref:Putative RING finger protein nhl-1-like n=1 Tax=Stichopus japonicus TaxID=307972 RepID=A0A2G8K4Q6_STIJA|nr:putative RING finger protein nhl-1-like [Apostichopus japonicus]
MIGEVTSAVQLCKDIHSSISQVKQTLFGNKKQQCEDLCNDTRFVENILKDLTKKINVNTDPGLLENVQNANKDLQKILTDVSEHTLKKYQLRKRHKLGKVISASNKSLQKVKENLKFAVELSQGRPFNQSSSGTVTDDSRGHETTDNSYEINESLQETNEPPTFQEIPGIIQPHDVITFKNQIFILMDDGIYAYNIAGNTIKRWKETGFKPFAATFLGNTLFVTDKKSKCVIKFDESLNEKERFGEHNMEEPAGITSCERENCIYVLTGRKKKSAVVAKFTSDGKYLGCYCSGSLEDPWYIKKSSSNEFFISDFARMAVDVYSYNFKCRLYTVKTNNHCRGMDIDNKGNIYIALRNPGYKAQYECIVRYN